VVSVAKDSEIGETTRPVQKTSTTPTKPLPQKPKRLATERLAEQIPGEERLRIEEEPRRLGGGSGHPLGYDIWSPLLDEQFGAREAPEAESGVARKREPRRGLRPFSDANHG
jgi:hypothetical protein